jgi:hypothetical protein
VDIPYARRSKFLDQCEAAIREHRAELDAHHPLQVNLHHAGGYEGRVIVTIHPSNHTSFATDWEHADPTRFPARIKAGATALQNCGCKGRFELSHRDGSLTIHAT